VSTKGEKKRRDKKKQKGERELHLETPYKRRVKDKNKPKAK